MRQQRRPTGLIICPVVEQQHRMTALAVLDRDFPARQVGADGMFRGRTEEIGVLHQGFERTSVRAAGGVEFDTAFDAGKTAGHFCPDLHETTATGTAAAWDWSAGSGSVSTGNSSPAGPLRPCSAHQRASASDSSSSTRSML